MRDQGWPVGDLRRGLPRRAGRLLVLLGVLGLMVATPAGAELGHRAPGFGFARIRRACQAPAPGHVSCFALVRTPASSAEAAAPGVTRFSLRDGAGTAGPAGGLTPAQLAGAYGYDPSAAPPSQQTIAVIDAFDDPNIESDLGAFDSQYGLAQCTEANGCFKKVGQTGKTSVLPAPDKTGWSVEISLDVEMAHAVCQHCRILLVEAENTQIANLGSAVNEAVSLGATEVSNSYGGPEGLSGAEAAYNHRGVVIAAATGDEGYNGWLSHGAFPGRPNLPAAFPTVVAVGGTTLSLDEGGKRAGETVWNGDGRENAGRSKQGATGGGCSGLFAAPSWQRAVAGFSATGCGTRRSVGDVAADADPRTGFDVYDSYNCGAPCEAFKTKGTNWQTIGGTSLSTPLISALYGLAGGANGVSYPALTLYGHLGDSSALYDVTEGGNGFCDANGLACGIDRELEEFLEVSPFQVDCEGTAACNAATGFDGPSAVGTPNSLGLFKAQRPSAVIAPTAKALAGEPVAFSGSGSSDPYPGGTPLAYHWSFGDGEVSSEATPSHVFAKAGEYHVALLVTDAYGIESLAAQSVVAVAERTPREIEEEQVALRRPGEEAAAKAAAEAAARRQAEEAAAKAHGGVAGSRTVADPAASLARRALRVSRSGLVTLLVTCPPAETSCIGTTTLRSLGARGRALVLSGGSFTVAGGGEKRVVLRLSKAARALLRRLRTLHAEVTILAHDPAGAHLTMILPVSLRGG